jgi:hypothetical protein
MKAIIDQILQWPVIVQGALGSALFWLILVIGERSFRKCTSIFRGFSKEKQIEFLYADAVRHMAFADKDSGHFVVLIYCAVHYVIQALLAICLGLIFESIFPVFGVVGFAMAIYYLFLALNTVRDTKSGVDHKKELEQIEKKIEELKAKA